MDRFTLQMQLHFGLGRALFLSTSDPVFVHTLLPLSPQAVPVSPTQPSGVVVSKGGGTPIIVGLLPTGGTPGRSATATVLSVSR